MVVIIQLIFEAGADTSSKKLGNSFPNIQTINRHHQQVNTPYMYMQTTHTHTHGRTKWTKHITIRHELKVLNTVQ